MHDLDLRRCPVEIGAVYRNNVTVRDMVAADDQCGLVDRLLTRACPCCRMTPPARSADAIPDPISKSRTGATSCPAQEGCERG